jgi:proton-dependent oligopeptide transporter, POT family
MGFDATEEATEVAKAEVKGLGMPTPTFEKQLEMEKRGSYVPSATSATETDDSIPTDEEIATLRRIPGSIPWICFTVAFVELCERFAYYGTTAVRTYPILHNIHQSRSNICLQL